ncbi:hypothetical protein J6590_004125 [Homalodisca vitripennis]|nr:hypothetical protein J6590_004125 [Homalodisca vitripennis]
MISIDVIWLSDEMRTVRSGRAGPGPETLWIVQSLTMTERFRVPVFGDVYRRWLLISREDIIPDMFDK